VQAISAPPTIRRVVVSLVPLFSRISIPKAIKKNNIDDMPKVEMPKVEMPNGFLSILNGKNPWFVISVIDPSAIWISNNVIAAIASNSGIRRLPVFI